MSKELARVTDLTRITQLIETPNNLTNFFDTENEFLQFRAKFIEWLVGNDPVIMNITVTSDIIKYNKLEQNNRSILIGNMVKNVSDKQSFVYNPHN